MKMLRRSQTAFAPERDAAIAALRRVQVVASDETGVRIEGSNAYQWVFRSSEAVGDIDDVDAPGMIMRYHSKRGSAASVRTARWRA